MMMMMMMMMTTTTRCKHPAFSSGDAPMMSASLKDTMVMEAGGSCPLARKARYSEDVVPICGSKFEWRF